MTRPSREYALLGLLALLWGSSYLFGKVALTDIPPLTLAATRVTLAAVMLLCVLRLQGASLPRGWPIWRVLLIQACFNSIGAWSILAWGQTQIDAALASVLNSTSPLFVFFITLLITRHEALSARKLLGAAIGVGGVATIVSHDLADGLDGSVLGAAAALFGAFLYGCAAVYGKRLSMLSPAASAAGTMLWATAVLAPVALIVDRPWTLAPSGTALGAALTLGLACTGAALLLYFRLLRTLGSLGVASQSYLRAGFGAVLGVVVLGERLSPAMALGCVFAVVGVALMIQPARKPLAVGRQAP